VVPLEGRVREVDDLVGVLALLVMAQDLGRQEVLRLVGVRLVERGADRELRPRATAEQECGGQEHEERHLSHHEVSPGARIELNRYIRTRPFTGSRTYTRPVRAQFIWYVTRNDAWERSRKYPVGNVNAPPMRMYCRSSRNESEKR